MNNTILIKYYQNRKLYDTDKSIYIPLQALGEYLIQDKFIKVIEVRTNEDITNKMLFQALYEKSRNSLCQMDTSDLYNLFKHHSGSLGKYFQSLK